MKKKVVMWFILYIYGISVIFSCFFVVLITMIISAGPEPQQIIVCRNNYEYIFIFILLISGLYAYIHTHLKYPRQPTIKYCSSSMSDDMLGHPSRQQYLQKQGDQVYTVSYIDLDKLRRLPPQL